MVSRKRRHSSRQSSCSGFASSFARHVISITSLFYLPKSTPFSIPSTPPTGESIVRTQLSHYKSSNIPAVYELCSPWFQDSMGSLSEFEESINEPPFNLLLNHERADVLLETLPETPEKGEGIQAACYLVCIKPGKDAPSHYPVWFWWETSRHYLKEEDLEDDDVDGEWFVDCIIPDFDDLEFDTESLVQMLADDDDGDSPAFFMDFADDEDEDDHDDDDDDEEDDGYY